MMTRRTLWPLLGVMMAVLGLLGPAAAQAETWWAQAGWTRTDVGLADQGNGFWVGAEGVRRLRHGMWELGYGLAYVQKAGAQTMLFSDIHQGNRLALDKVRLHVLQPAVSLGIAKTIGAIRVRLYGGGSVDLKMSEQWTHPAGSADRQYTYENLDLVAHVGLNVRTRRLMLDARYGAGLMDQLLVEGVPLALKSAQASDPLGGAVLPGPGAKIKGWRLGAGVRF